jgi:alanine-glyoxylate transaminase/serine-glyoxylate transaminase/serine-pyruvate transaminase
MSERPLLMIPGPIELSPGVQRALELVPGSHVAPSLIEDFGSALEKMREVWLAPPSSQPFVVSGGGTIAMEMSVVNLVEPGDLVLVVWTGYFSDRMAEMLRRRGAKVVVVGSQAGSVPSIHELRAQLQLGQFQALFATHVDTSTGVRLDVEAVCGLACQFGVLTVFDGVCATAAERFEMGRWQADVYLTASQKAIGLPAGLGLMVVSERAMQRRDQLAVLPPMSLDWKHWVPVMQAYESRHGAYFSTPATGLIPALSVSLMELLGHADRPSGSMEVVFEHHARTAAALQVVWRHFRLEMVPDALEHTASTLSALRYPEGVGPELLAEVRRRGVIIAGGLFPGLQKKTFRVGHMGYTATQITHLTRVVSAIGDALCALGHPVDVGGGLELLETHMARGNGP